MSANPYPVDSSRVTMGDPNTVDLDPIFDQLCATLAALGQSVDVADYDTPTGEPVDLDGAQ